MSRVGFGFGLKGGEVFNLQFGDFLARINRALRRNVELAVCCQVEGLLRA